MRQVKKLITKEEKYMKHLRIENRQGEFLRGNDWLVITEITENDILKLAKVAVSEEDFEVEPFNNDKLPNPVQNIIYQKISEQLLILNARKQDFLDETRNIYQDAYDKYCKE